MNNNVINPEFVKLPSQEVDFSLADLKQIIFRNWKPAFIVGATVFASIFAFAMLQKPLYESETFILLENSKNQKTAPISPSASSIEVNSFFNMKSLSTEILVLQSKSLISKAIQQYPETFQDLSPEDVSENLSITQALVDEIPTDILTVSYIDHDPLKAKAILQALGKVYVDYSLERQRSQAANAIAFIDEQLPESRLELDKVAYDLRHFRQENNLVDPNIYASEVSSFRQSLEENANATEIALEQAKSRYAKLASQIKVLGQNPDTILASSILSQDGVYSSLAIQLNEVKTQYLTGSTDFKDTFPIMQNLKSQEAELKEALKKRAKEVLGEEVSQKILDQAIISSTKKVNNSTTPTSNPIINEITSNSPSSESQSSNSQSKINSQGVILAQLGSQLLEAQNEITILESQIAGTSKAKTKVENNFQDVPQLQETFAELQRQLEVKSESVNYLLQRKQDLQIALAEETAPWQILDEPYLPEAPISPNIYRSLALALAGGGFLGILTGWLLHQLDTRVKLIDEIKQITQLPLLGAVPKVLEPRIILSNEAEISITKGYSYRYSSFTEAFRAIAMNLSYLMAKSGKIKSLVLTSSTSSEGKSTTTYNLGLALTDLGSRVLIVDADMRKPKIHKLTQQDNIKGLSEAIVSDEPWSEIVIPNVLENLDLITAGSNVPNPIAILRSNKMSRLLKEWEAAYDYVLIDTPPIGVMADAQSLINQVDTVMLVAGIDKATDKSLSHTLEILRNNNCNLAGFVANFVEKDLDYYSYSYYSHYYNQPNNGGNGNEPEESNSITQQFRRR